MIAMGFGHPISWDSTIATLQHFVLWAFTKTSTPTTHGAGYLSPCALPRWLRSDSLGSDSRVPWALGPDTPRLSQNGYGR
eukprot:16437994-Heterocapsa_arctica.AAC.1